MGMFVRTRGIFAPPLFVRQVIRCEQQATSRQVGDPMQDPVMQCVQDFMDGVSDDTSRQGHTMTPQVGRHDGHQTQPSHGGNPQFFVIGKV
eukprot:scaffold2510_cov169-Amphora_coffeaeformis.AAC.50